MCIPNKGFLREFTRMTVSLELIILYFPRILTNLFSFLYLSHQVFQENLYFYLIACQMWSVFENAVCFHPLPGSVLSFFQIFFMLLMLVWFISSWLILTVDHLAFFLLSSQISTGFLHSPAWTVSCSEISVGIFFFLDFWFILID